MSFFHVGPIDPASRLRRGRRPNGAVRPFCADARNGRQYFRGEGPSRCLVYTCRITISILGYSVCRRQGLRDLSKRRTSMLCLSAHALSATARMSETHRRRGFEVVATYEDQDGQYPTQAS